MAKRIVSQTESFCKVQNNPHVAALARVYAKSPNEPLRECSRILSLSNDNAVEILKSLGFTQVVPGTHFAPMYDLAKFFGVKEDSLYSYLQRYGLNHTDNPREAFSCDLRVFFHRAGLLKHGKIVQGEGLGPGGMFDFHFQKLDCHYVTEYRWSTRFYSARVAIAMLPLLANWNKKRNPTHKCVSLHEKVMAFVVEHEKQKEAEAIEKAATRAQVSEPAMGATISKDELIGMIKQAVREVLADTKVEVPATLTITT